MAPEYVVDASVVVSGLISGDAVGIAAHKLVRESTCHAPHLLDAEVGHVLRRAERAGVISDATARQALAALPALIEHRHPHVGRWASLAWELRHTVTFYDGLYAALATVLDVPLLTADARLARALGLRCRIDVLR